MPLSHSQLDHLDKAMLEFACCTYILKEAPPKRVPALFLPAPSASARTDAPKNAPIPLPINSPCLPKEYPTTFSVLSDHSPPKMGALKTAHVPSPMISTTMSVASCHSPPKSEALRSVHLPLPINTCCPPMERSARKISSLSLSENLLDMAASFLYSASENGSAREEMLSSNNIYHSGIFIRTCI
jgi:hypothetical protein